MATPFAVRHQIDARFITVLHLITESTLTYAAFCVDAVAARVAAQLHGGEGHIRVLGHEDHRHICWARRPATSIAQTLALGYVAGLAITARR
ncbi:MAG: hypothetical protein R3D25_22335 [Geminicoccaceae bacterium]